MGPTKNQICLCMIVISHTVPISRLAAGMWRRWEQWIHTDSATVHLQFSVTASFSWTTLHTKMPSGQRVAFHMFNRKHIPHIPHTPSHSNFSNTRKVAHLDPKLLLYLKWECCLRITLRRLNGRSAMVTFRRGSKRNACVFTCKIAMMGWQFLKHTK